MKENVVIIGASPKTERYANKAQKLLLSHGHTVYPVCPNYAEIEGVKCYKSCSEISDKIDTVTLYINPDKLSEYVEDIIQLNPKRVIMNPGTESDEKKKVFEAKGIAVLYACTLVMLNTNQY